MMIVWNAWNASQQADNFTSHNVSWMSLSSFEEARRVLIRSGINRPSRSGSSTNADLDAYQYVDDRRGFLGSGSVHSYRRPRSVETLRLSFETAPTPAMGRRRSRGGAGPERELPTDDYIPDLVSESESDSSDEEGTSAWATRRATRRRQPSLLRWQPRRPPWGIWERTLDAEPQVHRLTKANPRPPPPGAGILKDPERRSQREPQVPAEKERALLIWHGSSDCQTRVKPSRSTNDGGKPSNLNQRSRLNIPTANWKRRDPLTGSGERSGEISVGISVAGRGLGLRPQAPRLLGDYYRHTPTKRRNT